MSLNSKELKAIIDLGNSLGYVGDELKQFVNDERMRIEKEKENEANRAFELEKLKLQNAKEMEEQKNKAEAEEKRLAREAEAEQKKLQHEREVEEKRLEREAEEKRLASEAEVEEKRLQIEAEMAERERRTKLELGERAAQDKREQREFELKKLELQVSQNARNTQPDMEGVGDNNGGRVNSNMRGLKLPPFNPDKDDLDSYLTRFERACQAFDVDPRKEVTIPRSNGKNC